MKHVYATHTTASAKNSLFSKLAPVLVLFPYFKFFGSSRHKHKCPVSGRNKENSDEKEFTMNDAEHVRHRGGHGGLVEDEKW